VTTLPVTLQLFVAGKLINPLNARAHWSVRHRLTERWRVATRLAWLEAGRPTIPAPAAFTFTAYVAREWDHAEGIHAALKPVRDEAVAILCGTDDGPQAGHTYTYRQEVRPEYRGVLIEVAPR